MKKIRHKVRVVITTIIVVIWLLVIRVNDHEIAASGQHIYYSIRNIPKSQAVMILWASVRSNGTLSRIAQDRADMAIEVWKSGKADTILISADNGSSHYDETRTIRNYLIAQWVATWVIFQDFAWFDTYDSMYRARDIFQVRSLIISTQKFHQPRAVYIARSLWLDAVGIVADSYVYRDDLRNNLREMIARVKAWLDVQLWSSPKFGWSPIPITWPSNVDM
jgi:SanA protein